METQIMIWFTLNFLKEPLNQFSFRIYVNIDKTGPSAKSRHCGNFSNEREYEACTNGNSNVSHVQYEVFNMRILFQIKFPNLKHTFWSSFQCRIFWKRQVRLKKLMLIRD